MNEFDLLWETLKQPEYVHVLLNPLPVHGLMVAVLALVAAVITRSRVARVIALGLVMVTALSIIPVMEMGEGGYQRVYAMSLQDAQQWLDVHEHRAERAAIVYYITAVFALAAIIAPLFRAKVAMPLELAVVVVAIAALLAGAWVGHAGGKVRHPEFREGPPPPELLETHDI